MSTKRKLPTKLGQPTIKPSAKIPTKTTINDARAVVSGGALPDASTQPIEISSDSESNSDAESAAGGADVDMADAEGDGDAQDNVAEPSFGDLLLASNPNPIDVSSAFPTAAAAPASSVLALPSGASLGTVLTQALKTNDTTLLESCLQTTDLPTIRATIQRLSSPLASTLLAKLAARLHSRPGRAGSLMVWVQWTLVTHGGYLATQPDLIKKLADLHRVIDARARGLQSLLSLKGKLDMLEAQMQLRRAMRQGRRGEASDDDDDDEVVYVEGQDDSEAGDVLQINGLVRGADLSDSEESEDMPIDNGIVAEGDDSAEDESENNMLDDEAEETDADSGDEDEVDVEDVDSDSDDEDESDAGALPNKRRH